MSLEHPSDVIYHYSQLYLCKLMLSKVKEDFYQIIMAKKGFSREQNFLGAIRWEISDPEATDL